MLSAFFRGAKNARDFQTLLSGLTNFSIISLVRFGFLAKSVDFRFHKRKCTPFILKLPCFCCISFGPNGIARRTFWVSEESFVFLFFFVRSSGVESVFVGEMVANVNYLIFGHLNYR